MPKTWRYPVIGGTILGQFVLVGSLKTRIQRLNRHILVFSENKHNFKIVQVPVCVPQPTAVYEFGVHIAIQELLLVAPISNLTPIVETEIHYMSHLPLKFYDQQAAISSNSQCYEAVGQQPVFFHFYVYLVRNQSLYIDSICAKRHYVKLQFLQKQIFPSTEATVLAGIIRPFIVMLQTNRYRMVRTN